MRAAGDPAARRAPNFAAAIALGAIACGGAPAPGDAPTDQALGPVDWVLRVDPTPVGRLPATLLGHYDLSGALYGYRANAPLIDRMSAIGFAEWRVGLGRWEIATQLLPTLADGQATSCAATLARLPASAQAPAGATDASLIADRDWFTDNGKPVTRADTDDESRYRLDYVRSVIDTATALGAAPFVDIDHMPRALAVNQAVFRGGAVQGVADPCLATWTNRVSNVRPADPEVFAAAVVGAVRRVVEGSGGAARRPARYWELWNEPELGYAWDPSFELPPGSLNAYFAAALTALGRLADYRAASRDPDVAALRFGLGSFADATTAVGMLRQLDTTPLPGRGFAPLDFVSFHAYSNDPAVIVDAIRRVAEARAASTHYPRIELALAEWGPDLAAPPSRATMAIPLLVATVIARGAALGLEHAHHSLFYEYVPGLPFAAVAQDGSPLPLYHAYALLHALIGAGADRLPVAGATDGSLDGGLAAVAAARIGAGPVRLLLINRGAAARTARIELGDAPAMATRVEVFDDPTAPPREAPAEPTIHVPGNALVLVTLR